MIGILGSPTFDNPALSIEGAIVNGAQNGSAGWLQALLDYGHEPDGYQIFEMPDQRKGHPGHSRANIASLDDLPQALRRGRLTILHSPMGPDVGRMASVVHRCSAKPIPVTAIQYSVSYTYGNLFWFDMLTGPVAPWDCVVCTSQASRRAIEILTGHLREKIAANVGVPEASLRMSRLATIPLGVEPRRFWEPSDQPRARQLLGLPQEPHIVLSVGRLSPINKADLFVLIRALRRIHDATPCPPFPMLVLAGSDRVGYSHTIKQLSREAGVGDHVVVFPNLIDALLPAMYAAADVFVAPSDSVGETFGITLTEAMMSRLPVVASEWDGFPEVVEDGVTGYLVKTAWGGVDGDLCLASELRGAQPLEHFRLAQATVLDEGGLVAAVSRLLESQDRRISLGEAGRRRAEERFSWRVVVQQYEALWSELRQEGAGGPARTGSTTPALPYHRVFEHYASRRVQDGDVIVVRPRALLTWKVVRGYTAIMDAGINDAILERLLRQVESRRRVGEVVRGDDQMRMHLMWLAKHGFVDIVPVDARGVFAEDMPSPMLAR